MRASIDWWKVVILSDALQEICHADRKLIGVSVPNSEAVKLNLRCIFQKLATRKFANFHSLKGQDKKEIEFVYTYCFKFAWITSCDANALFWENGERFTISNLRMTFVVHWNANVNRHICKSKTYYPLILTFVRFCFILRSTHFSIFKHLKTCSLLITIMVKKEVMSERTLFWLICYSFPSITS